jgi:ubiquinone biosynthesis monooxygenase Coq7
MLLYHLRMRHYSPFDQVIRRIDKIFNPFPSEEAYSASLMRVNHSGEVCAQALYEGQALLAQDKNLENKLNEAAIEEQQHLAWCAKRLEELNDRPSLLNPLWSWCAFGIGMGAALLGDKISLGFLAETEFQVTRHLEKHLNKLPSWDIKSREIILKMRADELRHAHTALNSGGIRLPLPIRWLMSATAKVMTTTARFI